MVIVGVLPDATTVPVAVVHCQPCKTQPAGTVSVILTGAVELATVNAVLLCGLVVVVANVKGVTTPFVPPVKSKLPVPPTLVLRIVMVGFLVLTKVHTPTVPGVAVRLITPPAKLVLVVVSVPALPTEVAQLRLVKSKPAVAASAIEKDTVPELGTDIEALAAPVPPVVVIEGLLMIALVLVLVTVYANVPLPPTEFLTIAISTFRVFTKVQLTSALGTRFTVACLVTKS